MLSNSHVNKLSMIVTAGRNQTSCRFHTCGACSRLLTRGWEAKNLTPPPQTPQWCSAPSAKVLQNNGSTEWFGTPSELWVWCKTSSFHEKLSPTWLIDASLRALKCSKRNSGNFNPSTNVKESKKSWVWHPSITYNIPVLFYYVRKLWENTSRCAKQQIFKSNPLPANRPNGQCNALPRIARKGKEARHVRLLFKL